MRTLVFAVVLMVAMAASDGAAQSTLQRCLDFVPGQPPPPKVGPSPTTMVFCRQLPAWDIYEQAGEHFKAGGYAGAARLLGNAAKAGNPLAQLRLAMIYEAGDGVPRNPREALSWYRRAAEAGEPAAQAELGGYYEAGDGVPEDWVEAAKWYRKSAEMSAVAAGAALNRSTDASSRWPLEIPISLFW